MQELERFGEPAESFEDELGRLARIHDILDQPFVSVEYGLLPVDRPHRLTLVPQQEGDGWGVDLFALVALNGAVMVGRCDDFNRRAALDLEGFDPVRDEITSWIATRDRPLGNRADLWLGLRRFENDGGDQFQNLAYHFVVWVDKEGEPHLRPSQDDGEVEGMISPLPADHLPEWFREWNVIAVGRDLKSELPQRARSLLNKIQETDETSSIVWENESKVFGFVTDEQLTFLRLAEEEEKEFRGGARPIALALVRGVSERIRGVAAFDSRRLVAFEKLPDEEDFREVWTQIMREGITGFAFLYQQGGSVGWPDLLISYANSGMERLHFLEQGMIRRTWDSIWERHGLITAQKRAEVARSLEGAGVGESESTALRLGTVQAALYESLRLAPEKRKFLLEKVKGLFQQGGSSRILMPVVTTLLDELKEGIDGGGGLRRPLSEGEDFVCALLYDIYNRCAPVHVRERVDREVRILAERLTLRDDRFGSSLVARSTRNRQDILENHEEVLRSRIDKVAVGLERWGSSLVTKDYHSLETGQPEARSMVTLGGGAERPRSVAFALPKAVSLLEVNEDGRMTPFAVVSELRGAYVRLGRFPGSGGSHLLGLGQHGHLTWIALNGDAEDVRLDLGDYRGWDLAVVRRAHGDTVAAALVGRGQRSRLFFVAVESGATRDGEDLSLLREVPVAVPWARHFDIASWDDGVMVAIGSSMRAPVTLLHFDGDLKLKGQPSSLHESRSGIKCLCFNRPRQPTLLAAGSNAGFIWCFDLTSASGVTHLAWTYQLDGAIRALVRLDVDGESHFLAGSENGKLVLLRSRDGQRVWKGRFEDSILGISVSEDHRDVFVLIRGGWLINLECLDYSARRRSLVHSIRETRKLPRGGEGNDEWLLADADVVHTLQRILNEPGGPPSNLLSEELTRSTRARLMRWLAQCRLDLGTLTDQERRRLELPKNRSPLHLVLDAEEVQRILGQSTWRDISLLIHYLPDEESPWERVILEYLEKTRKDRLNGRGDDSPRARLAAEVALAQRMGRRAASPPVGHFLGLTESHWEKIELAKLLLQKAEEGDRRWWFSRLLPEVLNWPPDLVAVLPEVLPFDEPLRQDLLALWRFTQALENKVALDDLPGQSMERLGSRLGEAVKDDQRPRGIVRLLAALVRFHSRLAASTRDTVEDDTWREDAAEALGGLVSALYGYDSPTPPADRLVKSLRSILSRQTLADATDPLEEQLIAVERAFRKVRTAQIGEPFEKREFPWRELTRHLLHLTAKAIERFLQHQQAFLLRLVRPRITVLEKKLDDHRRLHLKLQVDAEGSRPLRDATLRVSCEGEGGLEEPGTLEETFHEVDYPGRFRQHLVVLVGFLPLGQERVTIETELAAAKGYRHRFHWVVDAPVPAFRQKGGVTFPGELPETFSFYVEKVLGSSAPLTLAVIDGDMGRDDLIEAFEGRFPGRVLDLDLVLDEYGPDRLYSNRTLEVDLLEETIERAVRSAPRQDEPFLVAPTSRTLQRILDAEDEEVLGRWAARLRERAKGTSGGHLVVQVGASHATRLRSAGLGAVLELSAHRPVAEISRDGFTVFRRELEDLIRQKEPLVGEPEPILERLGWDLRLVLRWLRWQGERAKSSTTLSDFLDRGEVRSLIFEELASLRPFEVLVALAGSVTETQLAFERVVPGMIAASEHRSTTRVQSAKNLIRAGIAYTPSILDRMRSDRNTPAHVRVRGFGREGAAEGETQLIQVLQKFADRRVKAFETLASWGIGQMVGTIYWTHSPYREEIQRIYRRSEIPSARRDSEAFSAILGRDRSPAEILDIESLMTMDRPDLQAYMPQAQKQDLRKLRNLASFWNGDEPADLAAKMRQVMQPEFCEALAKKTGTWFESLMTPGLGVFGLGTLEGIEEGVKDPEIFLVWVPGSKEVSEQVVRRYSAAAEVAQRRREELEKENNPDSPPSRRVPRIALIGPGVETLVPDPDRRVALVRFREFVQAVWDGDLHEGLRRQIRKQLRLTAFSPFQTHGALPPGSDLFVGREHELAFLKQRLRQVSQLIVGARRVGKTSLLNQVYQWTRTQNDLAPILIDMQGVETGAEFLRGIETADLEHLDASIQTAIKMDEDDLRTKLRVIASAAKAKGKLLVLLLNEIDNLALRRPRLIEIWRGLNDEGLARFVMVGYSIIAELGKSTSPFFHFAEGNQMGGRATTPAALSPEAGERLLDLLTRQELGLRWADEKQRREAIAELLERSYRIPWVLQRYGQLLVERMEEERRDVLRWNDVAALLKTEGRVVWDYIDGIDFGSLDSKNQQASRAGFKLLLFALARQRYFLGGRQAPIRDPHLADRSALALGFTVSEARESVEDALEKLLMQHERREIRHWLNELDLGRALRLLTLTLALEPDPSDHDRFGFLLHIVPMELHRLFGDEHPTLDDLIIRQTLELMKLTRREEKGDSLE